MVKSTAACRACAFNTAQSLREKRQKFLERLTEARVPFHANKREFVPMEMGMLDTSEDESGCMECGSVRESRHVRYFMQRMARPLPHATGYCSSRGCLDKLKGGKLSIPPYKAKTELPSWPPT
jgi:hypothetical protein